MKLSVCIPMYNESAVVAQTAKTLTEYLDRTFPEDYELLFSDDGSTDGCGDLVRSLGLPRVRVVGYAENRGKGCAVRTAMLEAKGDVVLFTDADLAYGTDVIGEAVRTLDARPECRVLVGSRNLGKNGYEGYTFLRKLASKAYIRVLCVVGGLKYSDSQCGFKAFRSGAAGEIFRRCRVDRFAFDFEVILWAQTLGYKIVEMPVRVINHRASSIRLFRDAFRMLRDVVGIRRRVKKQYRNEEKTK